MSAQLTDFFALDRAALEQAIKDMGQPRFRADQIWGWVYRQSVESFEGMSNVPAVLRRQLQQTYQLTPATVAATQADDESQTRKDLLRLDHGETIECVLMQELHGCTACISSQVGCAMACSICATGQAGFKRNLTAGEIVFQVVHFNRHLARQAVQPPARVGNVVFMGMGEPLLNYQATVAAVARLCDPYGLTMNPHAITISTVGLPERILALAREPLPLRLAISLHSANQEVRERLLPKAGRVPLAELIEACREYAIGHNQRITFEYALIDGVNDSQAEAHRLVSLIGELPAHVNLISLNPVQGCEYRPSSPEAVLAFQDVLKRSRIPCTVRHSRGVAIQAGCGQLRSGTT
jgi:23S rRNA (adenine2503-C2)-methyltransferase